MNPTYRILVAGNNLRLADGFLGIANVTLIESAAGPILFDTGGYVTRLTLVKALKSLGLSPADIKVVFLSHLHFDHAHNIDLFPKAKILVSKADWDYVADPHEDDLFVPWGIRDQLAKQDTELIAGDGLVADHVEFFPAPGHTPGSFAVRLETEEFGPVCIAGDAIKYAKEAISRSSDMAFDRPEVATHTIEGILDSSERIVPGHFPELIRIEHGFTWTDAAPFSLLVR